jgi:hypothetical protein
MVRLSPICVQGGKLNVKLLHWWANCGYDATLLSGPPCSRLLEESCEEMFVQGCAGAVLGVF